VFFVAMQQRRTFRFKAQHRWLQHHPDLRQYIGLPEVPNRTTLSRRYNLKVARKWRWPPCEPHQIWLSSHQIPARACRWVYGYGLHLVDNRVGFPKWVQIETAAVAESDVIDQQAPPLIQHLRPATVTTDNSYAKARRIRQWAHQGVVLLSPAVQWVKGRYALADHRYIQQPENAELLRCRRTAIEPVFDLIAQVLGTQAKQKQLPLQKLSNVRTCLAVATFTVQVAMMANSIWTAAAQYHHDGRSLHLRHYAHPSV